MITLPPPTSREAAFALLDIAERDTEVALRELTRIRRRDPQAGLDGAFRAQIKAICNRLDLALKALDAIEAPGAQNGRHE